MFGGKLNYTTTYCETHGQHRNTRRSHLVWHELGLCMVQPPPGRLADGISRAELKAGSARDRWLNSHLESTGNVSHMGTHRAMIWHDERMDGHLSFMLYPVRPLVSGLRACLGLADTGWRWAFDEALIMSSQSCREAIYSSGWVPSPWPIEPTCPSVDCAQEACARCFTPPSRESGARTEQSLWTRYGILGGLVSMAARLPARHGFHCPSTAARHAKFVMRRRCQTRCSNADPALHSTWLPASTSRTSPSSR